MSCKKQWLTYLLVIGAPLAILGITSPPLIMTTGESTVSTLTGLVSTVATNSVGLVGGYSSFGDGGGGMFLWNPTSTEASDSGTVIKAASVTTGRWFRVGDRTVRNARHFGATGNGVTTDTVALRSWIASGGYCFLPPGIYITDTLTVPTGTTLDGYGATLKLITGHASTSPVLALTNVASVTVLGLTIDGNYNTSLPSYAADGSMHGIYIQAAQNSTFRDLVIKDCETDGVYIIGYDSGTGLIRSLNLTFDNCLFTHNARNGVSIIDLTGGKFSNCVFEKSFGKSPFDGLDMESESGVHKLFDIAVTNCIFQNNTGAGVRILPVGLTPNAGANNLSFVGCSSMHNGSGSWRIGGSNAVSGHDLTNLRIADCLASGEFILDPTATATYRDIHITGNNFILANAESVAISSPVSFVKVIGNTFRKTNSLSKVLRIYEAIEGVSIRNNEFVVDTDASGATTTAAISLGDFAAYATMAIQITGNRFNGGAGPAIFGDLNYATLEGSTITDNEIYGVGSAGASGIFLKRARGCQVSQNIIHGCGSAPIRIVYDFSVLAGNQVFNNICWGNTGTDTPQIGGASGGFNDVANNRDNVP